MSAPQIVIIGSGPAGVSAAFPLVEAGIPVIMIDAGMHDAEIPPFNRDTENADFFLGKNYEALQAGGNASPKLRIPNHTYIFADYDRYNPHTTSNFALYGSLATGGLSNAWGAGVAQFDAKDLAAFPLEVEDLHASYRRVSDRIGVSGVGDDTMADVFGHVGALQKPAPLAPASERLLQNYQLNPQPVLKLGHARNAVITEDKAGRLACNRSAMCLWGCARKSIYNARYDLERLKTYANFTHVPGVVIDEVGNDEEGNFARGHNRIDGSEFIIHAPKIILAAGAIASAKLVLKALKLYDRPIPFANNPSAGFALLLPKFIGQAAPEQDFSLSQLAFVLGDMFGNLFTTTGLPASEFIRRSPLSLYASQQLFRLLMPAMLVGNCAFPATLVQHTLMLKASGELHLTSDTREDFAHYIKNSGKQVAASFRKFGAWLMPGSFSLAPLGSFMHYAATTPMRAQPKSFETYVSGEVAGLANIYVADGGALSTLPVKPHTLTIMANADRIARGIGRHP